MLDFIKRQLGRQNIVNIFVISVFVFGVVGTGAELILLEHTEDIWMWIPLGLMGLSILLILAYAVFGAPLILRFFRGLMVLFVVSGLLGVWLHVKGNVEFELEMYPSMTGFELFWESMKGATPALAPGAMTQLGLLGLVYTFKHPKLGHKVEKN